jgi:hypothetical protein
MSSAFGKTGLRAGLATGLLIAGLLFWALFRVVSGTEHHSFAASGVAPDRVQVTAGHTYRLAVKGGVQELTRRGEALTEPQCQWSQPGSGQQVLQVTPEAADSKAINVVATFTAPVSGPIVIDCGGWGPLYVDDADNAAPDVSGYLLVVAVLALTVGVGLALSVLRGVSLQAGSERAAGDDDQIEAGVDVGYRGGRHGKVLDSDGGDIGG